MHDPIPIELVEHFQRGNGLIILGDRAVRNAQGHVIVDDLAAEMARRMQLDGISGLSLPELAELYEDQTSLNQVHLLVRERLLALTSPQPIHRHIAALNESDVIVTTCLDRCLEMAFAESGRPLHVTVRDTDLPFASGAVQLYKLRGTLEQPDSMLLTSSEHERFYDSRQSVSVVLQSELARKTVLFLGYDLGDDEFQRLYGKVIRPLDRYARTAYAVLEHEPSLLAAVWCRKNNVHVIRAQPEPFLGRLLEELSARRAVQVKTPAPQPQETQTLSAYPYKWLDYYTAADVDIFYGREAETAELVNRIHRHRLVVLYGASGTGKTSLLQAGVLPRLQRSDPPYTVVSVRPLRDPADAIRQALGRALPQVDLPGEGSLTDAVAAAAKASAGTVLIVLDQFEEFFIHLGPKLRQAFVEELAALYHAQDVPVKLVISLREDWLASLSELETHIPDLFRVRQRLLPLSREQARQAITAPVAGLEIAYEQALVERLLADLGDGMQSGVMPPQLQLVCDALYTAAVHTGSKTIDLANYAQLGETSGILQRYLAQELARLPQTERQLAQWLLEEMVTAEMTKTTKGVDELALALESDRALVSRVLEKLVRARLLRPLEQEGRQLYELAHEYLIEQIELAPEALARKQAEELVRQEVSTWQRYGTLLSAERIALLHPWREQLRLDHAALDLLLRSALASQTELAYWFARAQQVGVDVDGILLPGLESESFRVRAASVTALAGLGDAYAEALIPLLDDDYPQVRASAIQGLERLRPDGGWRSRLVYECYVPAGPFLMGDDYGRDEGHTVHLKSYYIGKYAVTNRDYARFMEDRGRMWNAPLSKEDHPVVNVSWLDAMDYAAWARVRLPTEAEWEKAARGTDGRIYPWGNKEPDEKHCNYNRNVDQTTPVGIYSDGASPYGCLDMAGNVWEWTSSLYEEYPYDARDGRENPTTSGSRVLRGGSFQDDSYNLCCAFRDWYDLVGIRSDRIGFRIVSPRHHLTESLLTR